MGPGGVFVIGGVVAEAAVQDADEAVALLRPCVLFHGVLRDILEDVDDHGDGWTGGCPGACYGLDAPGGVDPTEWFAGQSADRGRISRHQRDPDSGEYEFFDDT